jgi:L-iditol 2-dehydrogenase
MVNGVVLEAAREVVIRELDEPRPGPGDVIVEVLRGGICGSDMHAYRGHHPFRRPPVTLGHEAAGRVLEVGDRVADLEAGQLVTIEPQIACGVCRSCRGGLRHLCVDARRPGAGWGGLFAQRVVAPADVVYRLPASVDVDDGVLVEPAAVAVRAVRRTGIGFGDRIAVLGAGPIGVLIACAARASGAVVAAMTDVKPYNLGIAAGLADRAVDVTEEDAVAAILDVTDGGADAIFVAGSVPTALIDAVAAVRPGGIVMQVAMPDRPLELPVTQAVMHEVDVMSSLTYSADDFRRAIDLVERGAVSAAELVTACRPYTEAAETFREIDGGLDHMKILLTFEP